MNQYISQKIYHITSQPEWNSAQSKGEYLPQGFAQENFIHCSYSHQILTVANRFYQGQQNLVILAIETANLRNNLIDENLEGGTELYPHLYSSLPIAAVEQAIAFPCNPDGSFSLPVEL